jgi:hypothetical protein
MKKILLYILAIFCFGLSYWQVTRFQSKREDFLFLANQNIILNDRWHIFFNQNSNYFYDWKEKQSIVDVQNKSHHEMDKKEKEHFLRSIISDRELFFINTVCGKYLPDKAFSIYEPHRDNSKTENGYSMIIPLSLNNEIILVKYEWNKSLSIIKDKIKKLDEFDKKIILPKELISNEDVSLCFKGIITPTNKHMPNKFFGILINFFVKNDLENNTWNNFNQTDLNKHLNNQKISKYFLETNIKNLTMFTKNYNHHIFYALMWLITGLYVIFFIKKLDNQSFTIL